MQTEKVALKEASFIAPLKLTEGAPKSLWNPAAVYQTSLYLITDGPVAHLELFDKDGKYVRSIPWHMVSDYVVREPAKPKPKKSER